jgi:heme oxygenase (mycobilin-producing)
LSYVVINAITVPDEGRQMFEERFAARAGEVGKSPGFEAFELLRPANEGAADRYFVYTRWSSKSDFEAWMQSKAFQKGHGGKPTEPGEAPKKPVGTGSEVLEYEVIQREQA